MRQLRVLVAALLLGLGAACGSGSTDDVDVDAGGSSTDVQPPPEASEPAADVALWLSASRVPPGAHDIVAVLVNRTDVDLVFGVGAQVEMWDGEQWVPHGSLVMCMDHWHCSAEVQKSTDEIAVPAIGLVPSPEAPGPVERFSTAGLEPGWYRISQTANEGDVAIGTFEVVEGAPPPPSLPAVDQPAISVQPVLVPSAGGTVTLLPLIPAPSGSQSIDDVAASVEGLSETAAVERWDGKGWGPVSEVPLSDAVDADPTVGRSAAIPELEPGAYRLVRSGPGQPHTGIFWVLP